MKLQFKTNINCGSCINAVTPFLNEEKSIEHWSVDVSVDDKILTVEGSNLTAAGVIKVLDEAGYDAEPVPTVAS